MKSKKGKILKVIPGINPNCSSGMFAMAYTIFSIPIYLVINIVTSVILFKKRNKERIEKDIDIFSISKSIKRLKYLILFVAILWMGLLIFTLSIEKNYGNIGEGNEKKNKWCQALKIDITPFLLLSSPHGKTS